MEDQGDKFAVDNSNTDGNEEDKEEERACELVIMIMIRRMMLI